MRILPATVAVACFVTGSFAAAPDPEALSLLRAAAQGGSILTWKHAPESRAGGGAGYDVVAVAPDGRYCVRQSADLSGTDPFDLAAFDGKESYFLNAPGMYDRLATAPAETRMVLTHWLLNPTPLLDRIADDLQSAGGDVTKEQGPGGVSILCVKQGLTFRVQNGTLEEVVSDRGSGAGKVRCDVVFSSFAGEGPERHPRTAVRTISIGEGASPRVIKTVYELARASFDSDAIEKALNPLPSLEKFSRRDLKTKNVYSPGGELKYNEDDLLAVTLGQRPWYTKRLLWSVVISVLAAAVCAYRLGWLRRSEGRAR